MGTETIEAARTLLVAVGGVTAAAAFVGLVVTLLRHALSLFEGAQEADRAVGRAARIAGFVLCIGFLLGGGGLAVSNAVTSGNAGWSFLQASSGTVGKDSWIPDSWSDSDWRQGWTTDGDYYYGDAYSGNLPSGFVDDGSSEAEAVKAAAAAVAATKGTDPYSEMQAADDYKKALEDYYAKCDKLLVDSGHGGSKGGAV